MIDFKAIVDNSNDVIISGDEQFRRQYVSKSIADILGYTPEAALAMHPVDDCLHPDDRAGAMALWAELKARSGAKVVRNLRYLHADGHYVTMECSLKFLRQGGVGSYVATLRDITDRMSADETIRYLATHDFLTDLPNRIRFEEGVAERLVQFEGDAKPFAVFACDLSDFKALNDTLGHVAGDRLLRIVAQRLLGCVRGSDMVARIGGDEFAIAAGCGDDPGRLDDMAQRIIDSVARPISLDGAIVEIGACVGYARCGGGVDTPQGLFEKAETALYDAKRAGIGEYRAYDDASAGNVTRLRQLKIDIYRAIQQNELYLEYQPVVNLRTNRIVSCEALLRWRHPVFGVVPPDEFISIAEANGQIVPIGAWVLEQACAEAREWPRDVRVSVNISSDQVRTPMLEDSVTFALAKARLTANRLKLEVTETVLLEEQPDVIQSLRNLREVGVLIALDDFGTRFSSINYLRRFDFDKIKLDKSFVWAMGDRVTAVIIAGIVSICRDLGIGIVAEGIETAEQLDRVIGAGCDEGQGYLFSRPLPAERIRAFLAEHAAGGEANARSADLRVDAFPPRPCGNDGSVVERVRVRG